FKGSFNFTWGCWDNNAYDQHDGGLSVRRDGDIIGGSVVNLVTDNIVQYVVFDGIDFDARGIVNGVLSVYKNARHFVFKNLEIRNSVLSCVSNPDPTDPRNQLDYLVQNVKVHHCGVPYDTSTINGHLAREDGAARFYQSFYLHMGGIVFD